MERGGESTHRGEVLARAERPVQHWHQVPAARWQSPGDVDVESIVREAEAETTGVKVLTVERKRVLRRQQVVVRVDGPDDAVRQFARDLRRWTLSSELG